jgi:hypothetical protein
MFVSMSGLEFFLLTRILTQNSNNVELVKFLGKNEKLHIQIKAVTLKMTSCRTMSKNKRKLMTNLSKTWFCIEIFKDKGKLPVAVQMSSKVFM